MPAISARYDRVDGILPFVANGVNVGMADAGELDVDDDVVGVRFLTLEGERRQRLGCIGSGVAPSCDWYGKYPSLAGWKGDGALMRQSRHAALERSSLRSCTILQKWAEPAK